MSVFADVWIVEAYDTEAGRHIVGVFDTEDSAERVAVTVPEPWAVTIDQRVIGQAGALPQVTT